MSTPATPPPKVAESAAQVTPGKPTVSFALDSTMIQRIVALLEHSDPPAASKAVADLFDQLGATTWDHLGVFGGDDAVALINSDKTSTVYQTLSKPIVLKRIGWIVQFARHGTLTSTTTIKDVIHEITVASSATTNPGTMTTSPSSVVDKKNIPKLESFSGLDEDWHPWSVKATDAFGRAGLIRYLTDLNLCTTNPEVAESVFYAIKQATNSGHGQSIANEMHSKGQHEPTKLWSGLKQYYDTAVNRANVVLFEIRRLLALRLDPDTVPTKFISDYRASLLRLTESKATLVQDTDTLRALLLVAIQNDDFDTVRDDILRSPSKDLNDFLTAIRDRDSSLQMKDAGRDITGDGVNKRYIRRTNTSSDQSGSRSTKWYIPHFPRTWANVMDKNIYRLITKWRDDAIRNNTSQWKLNENYDIVTDQYKKTMSSHGKRRRQENSNQRRNRRTKNEDADGQAPKDSTSEDQPDSKSPEKLTRAFKRIRLAHSGNVLFERPAGNEE